MLKDRAPLQPPIEPPSELPPSVLQAPINVRSTSLAVLALIAVIGLLYWARAVFIPIAIAVLASYALTPVVDWLKKKARLPKAVGAGLTLAFILVGLSFGLESLQPDAIQILDIVPRATDKLSTTLRRNALGPPGAVEKMQKAANEIEKVARAASTTSDARVPTTAAIAARTPANGSTIDIWDYVVIGTASALAGIGQLVVVALVYFLLIAGDSFRRTLMRISGDTLTKKKITLQILQEINSQIQRYLLVQLATSALLGVVAWLVLVWIGLDNALFWGCVGGVLHLIPYAGPTAFVFLVGLVAYAQFDSLQPVAFVIGSILVFSGLFGLRLFRGLSQGVGGLMPSPVLSPLSVGGGRGESGALC